MKDREIFLLSKGVKFPELRNRYDSGVIAFGGDLGVPRLLEAYSKGIFPWYDQYSPILWHSPMERCIFRINDFVVSHSLKQKLKQGLFTFTIDCHFTDIMRYCAFTKRKGEAGTWIFNETVQAYTALYKAGYAHSIEVWCENKLAGGLYGVSLGKAFFGESMFHLVTDASKAAMCYLFELLKEMDFHFVDAQMKTDHLLTLGASLITRDQYLDELNEALQHDTIKENWNEYIRRNNITPVLHCRGHKDGRD